MRLRARLLHATAIAPAAAFLAGALGSTAHARAEAPQPPQPVVVAVDPGHGGAPDRAHPDLPFDPGAIAASGLMEKDVTLDVGQRLAALLRQDQVRVVLTRHDDSWVDTPAREQIAIDAHAELFLSIHCNSLGDPTQGGSLILYPNQLGQPFAQRVSDLMGHDLGAAGIADDGVQLRDNWWIHNPMPTATAEVAYLSNPREAALMARPEFRQRIAAALRDGIEAFDPSIATRRAAILAWRRAHPAAAPEAPATRPAAAPLAQAGSPWRTVLAWLIGISAAAVLLRWRTVAARCIAVMVALLARLLTATLLRRPAARRRRSRARSRASRNSGEYWARTRSVYDELPL